MADYVPALRGHIGDWEYYVTIMKLADVAKKVHFAHQLHPHKDLDRWIQREISNRVTDMVRYLLNQPERFYGALIVAVYGGSPSFHPVHMAEHPLLDDPTAPFGLIKFDGSQQYFALDGQHRLESIREAIEQDRELGKEEISVVFVPHYDTSEGQRRTRRLFTTVNRYAKPTASYVNIAMDEDDSVAIVTRRLLREHPLFRGEDRVKVKGKSIPGKQSKVFTTLSVLYEMNENFLHTPHRNVRTKEFKQFRPDVEELDVFYDEVSEIWDALVKGIVPYREIAEGRSSPGYFRLGGDTKNERNGHLLFRPIGQLAMSQAIRWALNEGKTISDVAGRLSEIDWRLGEAPWHGTVWRAEKMITAKEMQRLTAQLVAYLIGLENVNVQALEEAYQRELEDPAARLPARE